MSHQKDNQYRVSSFAEFKKYREEISDNICPQLIQIFQECASHELSTNSLITEIENLCQKLQNQNFTVAVVGEFSRGKSTLINALIGEQIQPVRAIACSSTITFLKHGLQKRIICHYKNGDEKEISFEEYNVLATLSKEAVRKHRGNELANFDIDQIIFEHPDLELCKHGVLLVDSPGLNEHPDRTAITQKLLKNIDAVVFLTIASSALSETECELVRDVITQINNGEKNQPANNLFLVVNQIDALDSEEDRQDVSELVEEFAYGENPIILGKNRVHFISAKEAIKAFTNKTENEYSKTFNHFTQSLEEFLTSERGAVEINNCAMKIQQLNKNCLMLFEERCNELNLKIKESEAEKYILIEQIGELSGHGVKIRIRSKNLMDEMLNEVKSDVRESWNNWVKEGSWQSRLSEKSKNWRSDKNIFLEQKGIVEDYVKEFTQDLTEEIEGFVDRDIRKIIKNKLEILDVKLEIEIQEFVKNFDNPKGFKQSLKYEYKLGSSYTGGFVGDFINYLIGVVVAVVTGLIGLLILQLFNPIAIGIAVTTAITAIFTGAGFSISSIYDQIKKAVFEECKKQVRNVEKDIILQIIEQLDKVIHKDIFEPRLNALDEMIAQTISSYDASLAQKENEHNTLLEQIEIEKAFINQKRQELEQVQKELQTIINKSTTL
jgi:GTPase SAR1 family protein